MDQFHLRRGKALCLRQGASRATTRAVSRSCLLSGLLGASLMLSGCGGDTYTDPADGYITPSVSQAVDTIIAQQQGSAVEAIQTVARIERTRTPPTVTDPNAGAPPELQQRVTELNWSGPADGLVKALAEKIGYSYLAPMTPLDNQPIVTVDIRDRTVAEALDAIDLQVHAKMRIIVDADARTMTVQAEATPGGSAAPDMRMGPPGGPGPGHPPPRGGRHGGRKTYHPGKTS